jgi:hypothetical protein
MDQQRLPEGLADMPPGPALATVLAGIDPAVLNGHDLVSLATVYAKMVSHYQAGLAGVLDQMAHCPAGGQDAPVERRAEPGRWVAVEVAAGQRWSVRRATMELRYAEHLLRRLPNVHAALAAGLIDQARARALVDGLACVDDERSAQAMANGLLAAGAAGWDLRTLTDRLRRRVIADDPPAAARRYAQRLSERRLQARPDPDGTAALSGLHLPLARVAEIGERVGAIARTAKRQGDPRTIDQLKADVFADLLAGTGIGATPAGSVTCQGPIPVAPTATDEQAEDDTAVGGDGPAGSIRQPDAVLHTASAAAHVDDHPPCGGPDTPLVGLESAPAPEAPLPGPRRGVLELTAPLSALIGLSQAPGLVAGYGPVIADVVRQIVAEDPSLRWRYSIYDDLDGDGQLAHHGITHARPTRDPVTGQTGFSAADAAFLRARDRTCRGPQGCPVPASACELDHTIAKADGGGHGRGNGGALCSREHHFKHQAGARLRQPQPGLFEWTTPLGHRYTIKPEPYDESTGPPDHGPPG